MKLPKNSLGISDAISWHECPKGFHRSMIRHTRQNSDPDPDLTVHERHPLSFGSCLHDAAEAVVNNPDIYLDDAVDGAWSKWSHHLTPEHHSELRDDVSVIIRRTKEAEGRLELICAEREMSVPLFVGTDDQDLKMLDEEALWYHYRFRIDALYRDKDDPTHFIIRDFKSYRNPRYQADADADLQFTAYVYGIMNAYQGDCERVTVWCDQSKFGELFTQRTEVDLAKFELWIISTIRAVLNMPEEEVASTFKLNQWCGWCPMLENCGVVEYATDLQLAELAGIQGHEDAKIEMSKDKIERYERSKQAVKALDSFQKNVGSWLKKNPGVYGGKEYYVSQIEQSKFPAKDVLEILGSDLADLLPEVSSRTLKGYLDDPAYRDRLMAVRTPAGYSRLNSRKVQESDA